MCQACGAYAAKWAGRCDACGEWNTLQEEAAAPVVPGALAAPTSRKSKSALAFYDLADSAPAPGRLTTGIAEFDRALGGGLAEASAVLIGGDPGVGKSTLLLQAAAGIAAQGKRIAYITGEEALAQVQDRARRLGVAKADIRLAAETDLRAILDGLKALKPDAVIIDSIQTLHADGVQAAPGTVLQVRACAHELVRFAKKSATAVVLVGHVTKDGQIAGPRVVEHLVDAVIYFEGERGLPFRILRAVKNRYGAADEIGVFEMSERGLVETPNPSALFLPPSGARASGAAVFAGVEGSRPILMEVQALVAPAAHGGARRAVTGWDATRLAMVLAVLETRCGLGFAGRDVYLNIAGGLKISEPAADLAVAAALLSAVSDRPIPPDTVVFGEIALSGDVRPVGRTDLRLKEARKLGFARAYAPAGGDGAPGHDAVVGFGRVSELAAALGAAAD